MKNKIQSHIPVILALILGILCAFCLMIYVSPMEDLSLDLSLVSQEDAMVIDPADFDSKGWTVYTQEGETVTELTSDGLGSYSGLELGQTFYYSRVLSEELDSPTLQLGAVEYTFSVWLDDVLIYTDCPDLDNRIGYLRLPMNEWYRDSIVISLPMDYQGKTLTIGQSFPEYSETSTIKACPTSVLLYCGYAYESELISESFQTAIIVTAIFLIVLILLVSFVRNRDWSILCLALMAFCWMASLLVGTSFFYKYYGTSDNATESIIPLISSLVLLVFLTLRGGKHRKLLWGVVGLYTLSVIGFGVVITALQNIPATNIAVNLFIAILPWWFAFVGLVAVLVLGAVYWRKESWFYRVFTPTALACILVSWLTVIFFLDKGFVCQQIAVSLGSGQIQYIYYRTMPAIIIAALFTAIAEFIRTELNRRAEQHLMNQNRELALASYDNLRHQHEEVMMLHHDMLRHFHTLHDMGSDKKRTEYLAELIGQNEKIRPVVESGNEMLDIILNGRLGAAADAGIRVEIPHITAPSKLPLSDPDLCALVMNIVDNAIAAASKSVSPYIQLKIHEKDNHLGIVCENSLDQEKQESEAIMTTGLAGGLLCGYKPLFPACL